MAGPACCFCACERRNRESLTSKIGVTGEIEPGLSVRYMGTSEHSIASHLVTRYFSAAILTEDAIARPDNVSVNFYHSLCLSQCLSGTFRSDQGAADGGDAAETALMARLAKEIYSEGRPDSPISAVASGSS